MPSSLFPILLIAHIALAICLVLPSILLPFTLRTRRATVDSDSRVVQGLLYAQTHGTIVIGAGLAITGLGLAFFIQRPNLRRLVGVTASADDRVWKERAKRQRYISYLMAGLVGTIGFLMSTKPVLW